MFRTNNKYNFSTISKIDLCPRILARPVIRQAYQNKSTNSSAADMPFTIIQNKRRVPLVVYPSKRFSLAMIEFSPYESHDQSSAATQDQAK